MREEDHHPPPLGPKRGAGLEGSPTQGWTTRFSMIAFARPSALLSGVAGCASLFFFCRVRRVALDLQSGRHIRVVGIH